MAAAREVVARKGLFITKKRYAALVYDIEGFRSRRRWQTWQSKSNGLRPCVDQ